ncbi:MAG: hypothetical protein ACXVZ4_13085 [Gaiellaceae bacterium]
MRAKKLLLVAIGVAAVPVTVALAAPRETARVLLQRLAGRERRRRD